MTIEIKVPVLPESVADATILAWHPKEGDFVKPDSNLLDLETDKVVLEVPAPVAGRLVKRLKQPGDVVKTGDVLGLLEEGISEAGKEAPASAEEATKTEIDSTASAGPAARREAAARDISLESVSGTGRGGRVTREDVIQHSVKTPSPAPAAPSAPVTPMSPTREARVPMTRLRATIAKRLVSAQQESAILTTYNEINLQKVMDLRAIYKDMFEKKYGVRLGFMSFFTKAVVEALKQFPAVNASIEENTIIYHHYYDIGIAVSTERGLVVPIIRSADTLGFAAIEKSISDYGKRARDGQITLDELTGGTFTITNGGVFGSLLSSPIINPPQSAILGMHKIEERPVVEKGQIVIRPMMYVALSYDHRLIDGRDSVGFLVAVKNLLEDPARLLLEV